MMQANQLRTALARFVRQIIAETGDGAIPGVYGQYNGSTWSTTAYGTGSATWRAVTVGDESGFDKALDPLGLVTTLSLTGGDPIWLKRAPEGYLFIYLPRAYDVL